MKNFEEIYNELQNNNNTEFNETYKNIKEKRQKTKKITLTICLIIDIFLILIIILNTIISGELVDFAVPFIIFAISSNIFTYIIVYICVGESKERFKYNSMYKIVVIKKLISNFYNNLKYFPTKKMPEDIYKSLNYENYDTYKSDDYFEALIDNKYSIQMAEIKTQKIVEHTDSEGNTTKEYVTKFHGLFSKIVTDKSIKSTLIITPNKLISFDKDKLDMDSSEFEKYFDVSASNKIIGMQLLTSDIMEDLIEFKVNTNMQYDIYIANNEIYLRFHSGEMFESQKLTEEVFNKDEIKKYFYMLNFTYNLSKKLIDVINQTQI